MANKLLGIVNINNIFRNPLQTQAESLVNSKMWPRLKRSYFMRGAESRRGGKCSLISCFII